MEILVKNCSLKDHKNIEAIIFCQECKVYMCNKCANFHSKLCENHHTYNLKDNIKEIFTGLCKEENHSLKLDFYCKTHNELCCVACLSKLKNQKYGQHNGCDVYGINDIKDEKKRNLNKNIKILEGLLNNLEYINIELKNINEKIIKDKEELKTKIQKIFTEIRNSLNEREDQLLLEVDNIFNNIYFKEEIIKEIEKMPKIININLDKGKKIDNNEWNDENKIHLIINDCIKIEKNIQDINHLNENIKKNNYNDHKIKFVAENNDINNILKMIKEFGNIKDFNKVKFVKEVINIDVLNTNCYYINIDDIKIENIGNEILNNLYFIRDEKQSSENFIIYQTKKINVHKLDPYKDEFGAGRTETHSITLRINNPKPNKKYKLILYARQKENGENISKPLEIICTVNEDNNFDYQGLDPIKVNDLANDLDDEFNIFSIVNKEEVINKIIELRCDKEKIDDWIADIM